MKLFSFISIIAIPCTIIFANDLNNTDPHDLKKSEGGFNYEDKKVKKRKEVDEKYLKKLSPQNREFLQSLDKLTKGWADPKHTNKKKKPYKIEVFNFFGDKNGPAALQTFENFHSDHDSMFNAEAYLIMDVLFLDKIKKDLEINKGDSKYIEILDVLKKYKYSVLGSIKKAKEYGLDKKGKNYFPAYVMTLDDKVIVQSGMDVDLYAIYKKYK